MKRLSFLFLAAKKMLQVLMACQQDGFGFSDRVGDGKFLIQFFYVNLVLPAFRLGKFFPMPRIIFGAAQRFCCYNDSGISL